MRVLFTMLMSREAGPKSGISNSFGETVANFCENSYTCSDVFCYHASLYMDNNKLVLAYGMSYVAILYMIIYVFFIKLLYSIIVYDNLYVLYQ